MQAEDILKELESHANPDNLDGMRRFGIITTKAFGITIPVLRDIARKHKQNHELAIALWNTGLHEAKILAAMIGDPKAVTEKLMDAWVYQFDNWAVCDGCCGILFDKTPFAYKKAIEWCHHEEEYVRRAGFVMMAELAVHDKKAPNDVFISFIPFIEQYAFDERNFVKKAVNWALRQIGKRNKALHDLALDAAYRIKEQPHKAARWIAADAIRELENPKTISRIKD